MQFVVYVVASISLLCSSIRLCNTFVYNHFLMVQYIDLQEFKKTFEFNTIIIENNLKHPNDNIDKTCVEYYENM